MEFGWFFQHMPDVLSDMSVFHRVEDMDDLTASRFFALMFRLPFYSGAVSFALQQEFTEPASAAPQAPPAESMKDITEVLFTNEAFMGSGTYVTVPAT